MTDLDRYHHPLTQRYASREMQRVFSPANRYGTWRRLWLALAESEREVGLDIPDEALEQMRANLDGIDFEKAAEYEKRFRHDVMAHVHLFGDDAPAAAGIIHLGATSAFIGDNTDLILHREALQLIRDRLVLCIEALADFAREWRDLPTLGYTHFQPAQPTTVGKRCALWLQDLVLDVEELDFRLETLRFRGVRGTTGTQASFFELLGDHDRVDALDRAVGERMGFRETYPVSGQTYTRKVDFALQSTLAGVAAWSWKRAHGWGILGHRREVEEPWESEQIGSSAMPYKRNPMRAERITALARHVIVLAQDPAFTAATQWLERTLDDSANRRLSIPDAYLALDGALVLVENVARGLVVNPAVIAKNLDEHLPFMATETILMKATRAGGDRQELHERIRRHALAAAGEMKAGRASDLVRRIAGDEAFGMDAEAIEALIDARAFVGRAPEQVDRMLAEAVQPILDRHLAGAKERVGAPEVRV